MTIDWTTVVFQIINFLILVFLLRRFLYRPIVEAMEKREQAILDRENQSHQEHEQAVALSNEYQDRIDQFEKNKDQRLKEVHQEVKDRKQQLMDQTKEDVATMKSQWQREVKQEASLFMDQLKVMISKQACDLAKQTLKDLASASLQDMIFDVFITKLDYINESENKKLIEALQHQKKAKIISTFDIDDQQIKTIKERLSTMISDPLTLDHSIDPSLICGFALEVEGYQVMFNIEHYLDAVEKQIVNHLHQSLQRSNDHEA